LADTHGKPELFTGSVLAWMADNPTKNYQDLEQLLRTHKFNTYLFAKPYEVQENQKLLLQGKSCEYECVYIGLPEEESRQTLLELETYETNYANLAKAGDLFQKDESEHYALHKMATMEPVNQQNVADLMSSKVKIRAEQITPEEIVDNVYKELLAYYQQEPDVMVIGQIEGKPIYAFTIKDQLVSDVGFRMEKTDDKMVYEIIRLTMTQDEPADLKKQDEPVD